MTLLAGNSGWTARPVANLEHLSAGDWRRARSRLPGELETCESMSREEASGACQPRSDCGFLPVGDAARRLLLRLELSGVPFGRQPERGASHGGARNRADRTSDGLSLHQCQRIAEAALRALALAIPFNRFVTIHWELAGVPDAHGSWATGRFIKLASDWLAKRRERFAWAWVRENGEGKGSHVHMLLHVPVGIARAFAAMQRRWLRRITGNTYRKGAIKSRPIGRTLCAAYTMPEHYRANLATAVAYMLKGASAEAAEAMRLPRIVPSGVVIGKRAACSQILGNAAQAGAA